MAKAFSKAELAEYFELEERRLSLQRQAKDLAALQEKLEENFRAYVESDGGTERALMRCGYRLAINTKPGSVRWKNEFVRVAGSGAAEELIAAAPTMDVLVIEPPA